MIRRKALHCQSADEVVSLRSWLAVAAVTLGSFAFVTTEFLPVGLLPQIAHRFGVTSGTAGLLVSVPGVVAAIAAPGVMLGAGTLDRRHVLLLLSALLLLSDLMSACAPDFAIILLARALFGAGIGGFWALVLAAAGQLVRVQDVPKATAAILAGATGATVVGVPLGTFIAAWFSWRTSFVATGVLAGIALVAQMYLIPSLPSAVALRRADLACLLLRPSLRGNLLMVILIFTAHFSSYTYIAPYLLSAGFNLNAIGWLLLGFGGIGFLCNLSVSTLLARRLGAVLGAITATLTAALLIMSLAHGVAPAVAVCAWGAAFGALPLCLSLWMQRATPDYPEAGSALFVSAIQVSIALGSSIGGVMVDRLGIGADLRLGAAFALCGLMMVVGRRVPGRDAPLSAEVREASR